VLGGPSKYVLSFKVEDIKGLPETGLGAPFTVKMTIKGTELSRESHPGWSKYVATATPKTLENIRKLHQNKCAGSVIADVVDVNEDLIAQFLTDSSILSEDGKDEAQKEKHAEDWLEKFQEHYDLRESSRNPQFEEVLRTTLPNRKVTALVELLNDPSKRTKTLLGEADTGVVGQFELKLGKKEVVEGPFELLHPHTNKPVASLVGAFTIWRLEHEPERLQKLKVNSRNMGIRPTHYGLAHDDTQDDNAAEEGLGQGSPQENDASPARKKAGFATKFTRAFTFGGGGDEKRARSKTPVKSLARGFTTLTAPTLAEASSLAKGLSSAALNTVSTVGQRPTNTSRVEEALAIIEGGTEKFDVLCGLGMLHGWREWDSAKQKYRQRHRGSKGQLAGKGSGDLLAALETHFVDEADRSRAAHLLKVNGIGSGSWPPGSHAVARTGSPERPAKPK